MFLPSEIKSTNAFGMISMSKKEEEKIAFVISPIGDPGSEIRKRADLLLKFVIEPSASECGYKVLRADKISEPGIITSQVIMHVINDPLLIADLTGHNPNVFYELAVRHAMKRPVVQLIQEGERIPFDVSTTRTVQIDHENLQSVDEAKKEIVKQIHAVEKNPAKVDSPISIAVDLQFLKESEDPQRKALAEIRSMIQQVYSATVSIRDSLGKVARPLSQRTFGTESEIFYPMSQEWVLTEPRHYPIERQSEESYLAELKRHGLIRKRIPPKRRAKGK